MAAQQLTLSAHQFFLFKSLCSIWMWARILKQDLQCTVEVHLQLLLTVTWCVLRKPHSSCKIYALLALPQLHSVIRDIIIMSEMNVKNLTVVLMKPSPHTHLLHVPGWHQSGQLCLFVREYVFHVLSNWVCAMRTQNNNWTWHKMVNFNIKY